MRRLFIRASATVSMLAGIALIAAVASPAQATPSITASGVGSLLVPASYNPVLLASGSDANAVAVTPNGQQVYVTETGANEVAEIDPTTGTVTQIPLAGVHPDAVAASLDGQFIFVADDSDGFIERIKTSDNSLDGHIALGSGAGPTSLAISHGGTQLLVDEQGAAAVQEISVATFAEDGIVNGFADAATTIAASPVGSSAWVVGGGAGTTWAQEFNPSTLTLGPSVALANASDPFSLAFSPDGATVYIGEDGSEDIRTITTATDALGTPVPVGGTPDGIAVSPDGKSLFAALNSGVKVYSTSDLTSSPVSYTDGDLPYGVAVSADGRHVYFADQQSAAFSAFTAVKVTVTGPGQIDSGAPTTTFTVSVDDGNTPVGNYSADTAGLTILNSANTPVASQFGSFNATTGVATITVPTASIPDGKYTVEGAIEDTQTQALAYATADPFVVGTLATTGTDVAAPLTVGALLVLVGGVAFAFTRRRRRVAS